MLDKLIDILFCKKMLKYIYGNESAFDIGVSLNSLLPTKSIVTSMMATGDLSKKRMM